MRQTLLVVGMMCIVGIGVWALRTRPRIESQSTTQPVNSSRAEMSEWGRVRSLAPSDDSQSKAIWLLACDLGERGADLYRGGVLRPLQPKREDVKLATLEGAELRVHGPSKDGTKRHSVAWILNIPTEASDTHQVAVLILGSGLDDGLIATAATEIRRIERVIEDSPPIGEWLRVSMDAMKSINLSVNFLDFSFEGGGTARWIAGDFRAEFRSESPTHWVEFSAHHAPGEEPERDSSIIVTYINRHRMIQYLKSKRR